LEQDLPDGAALMADAYSPAAILSYFTGRYVPVYGTGRHHARQDDQLVDFRDWEGRRVRVLFRQPVRPEDHAAFFDAVSVRHFKVAGVSYYALEGTGFRYAPYRDQVLGQVVERFYAIPAGLPLWGSPFCERYGFTTCAPGR
jgi:hypothetical protein